VNFDGVTFQRRLDEVRGRIAAASARVGRPASDVILVAVTKTVPAESVRAAVERGLTDLGENRVQEAQAKIPVVGRERVRWHLIGHLQSNKAGRAIELFDRIHGVDDAGLAQALSRRAGAAARTMPVLIEVNVSGEPSKFGVAPEALGPLIEQVAPLPGLRLDGLMTVGAWVSRPEDARPGFARLRALRDESERRIGRGLPELSMGMSGDFEVAVEEGSTMVRVGTALFGPRAGKD
jgi:pyridoxal phosphate enzyme (YggS family)